MYPEDKKLLQELQLTKNIRDTTLHTYKSSIKQYTQYCGQSMTQLLKEADKEEEKGIRWKNRKIRQHLIGYRTHLLQKYEYQSTMKIYLGRIMSIYRHYEIELQPLPPVSTRNKRKEEIKYTDLPTKAVIRKAAAHSDAQMKAIILFMSSSGTGRMETTKLTIQDFINSTRGYHNSENIIDVLMELDQQESVVPTWRIHRQKTNKEYYTFSSPESTRAIIDYLEGEERRLSPDARLFNIGYKYLTTKFAIVNDRLGFGKVGHSRRLRAHMLRKYHASRLTQGRNALTVEEVDSLQGRAKSNVHLSYFFDNPEDLKRKYVRNLSELVIFEEVKTDTEYEELLRKYEKLKADVKAAAREEVKQILRELGYDL